VPLSGDVAGSREAVRRDRRGVLGDDGAAVRTAGMARISGKPGRRGMHPSKPFRRAGEGRAAEHPSDRGTGRVSGI